MREQQKNPEKKRWQRTFLAYKVVGKAKKKSLCARLLSPFVFPPGKFAVTCLICLSFNIIYYIHISRESSGFFFDHYDVEKETQRNTVHFDV